MKNVMSIFESRINDIFSRSSTSSAPIQFRRLAKKTIREMENETFVIDGIDTAPALYTILVSAADDQIMRPLYVNITEEVSSLVEAQAKKRGYSFVGKPLVRFMIDPSLKQGKYAIFAENIDPRTLARLRDEENAFLGLSPQAQAPLPEDEADQSAGLTRMPADEPSQPAEEVTAPEVTPEPAPEPEAPVEEPPADAPVAAAAQAEEPTAAEEEPEVPRAPEQEEPSPEPVTPAGPAEPEPAAPEPQATAEEAADDTAAASADDTGEISTRAPRHAAAPKAHPTCTLTDQQTGRVYTISSDHTPIGRERVAGGIVLRDPNVSRKHAELTYDGHEWHITDLHSTNGTLVNDIDIDECSLRDGDVLTIGLLNFVFREN